jgi:hypothetical protein
VASGTISTCVAAIGCMLSLWNLSRLAQLRLRVAGEIEEWLLEPFQAGELSAPLATTDSNPEPTPQTQQALPAEEKQAHAI